MPVRPTVADPAGAVELDRWPDELAGHLGRYHGGHPTQPVRSTPFVPTVPASLLDPPRSASLRSPTTGPTSRRGGDEFARVDPRTLIIETNVRARTNLDPAFLASIRTHGVRQPVQAHREIDGTLVVRAGQRRTLAAIETGQATIPVYITGGPGSEPDRVFEDANKAQNGCAVGTSSALWCYHADLDLP